VTRRAAPPVALALAAVALPACGGRVDRRDLESKIADFVQRQTGTTIEVHCPDGVKAKKGTRVRCTTVLAGAPADIDIVFTQDDKFRIAQTRVRNPG
jgi:Domain of unknown function (DUF4333)